MQLSSWIKLHSGFEEYSTGYCFLVYQFQEAGLQERFHLFFEQNRKLLVTTFGVRRKELYLIQLGDHLRLQFPL